MVKIMFVLLLFVTIAFAVPQYDYSDNPFSDPTEAIDNQYRGKPCWSIPNSALPCGYGFLYCINGVCIEKRKGIDCVAEVAVKTIGHARIVLLRHIINATKVNALQAPAVDDDDRQKKRRSMQMQSYSPFTNGVSLEVFLSIENVELID
ncbi:hypothetical protein BCR42DRAFT_396964 [Absidia repens]|uniref:Uncharacterized protein n=1 Tax=Absidia repens TaxID=90262 RepID=A0A1X2I2Z3_9FUNG|nr:hypothetical protein BCR42DRAFT_396964 [Absidia repens]